MTDPTPEPDKSDHPTSKGKLLVERLNAYRNLILAVAALATAITSWFKPTDTTATKNSFEWTSQKIEQLSANDLKTQQDLVAIRNYLEGYVQAQRGSVSPATPTSGTTEGNVGLGSVGTIGRGAGSGSGSGFGSGAGGLARPRQPRRPRPPVAAPTAGAAAPTASVEQPVLPEGLEGTFVAFDAADEPPPLPVLQSNPTVIKRPEFEQIAQ